MTTMFKISEEDFAFGDEDFWCEATAAESSSKPLNVQEDSDVKTTRSLATYNHVHKEKSRIPIDQKGSNPNFVDVSIRAMTQKDPNIGLDVSPCITSAYLPKRKFSFKPKSPKGCLSIPIKTVKQGIISTSKSIGLNDSTCTSPVNNSNLQVGFGSKEIGIVQDKRKNIQTDASILRPISYHVGVTPNFSHPAVTLNAMEKTHAKIKSTNNTILRGTVGVDGKTRTPHESQLRNTIEGFQTSTTTQPNQALTMQGKQLDSEVKTVPEIVFNERNDNFDEQFNLWEDDFDWDSVIVQPSKGVTKIVSKEESKSRSAHPATSQPCITNNVKRDCNISQPYAGAMDTSTGHSAGKITQQRPIINFETLSGQEKGSIDNGGMSHVVHNSSAFACPSNSYGSNNSNPIHGHRINLPHSVQEPISHKKTSHTTGQQLQGNPPRTNFLPRTPSPSCPNQRSSTPFQLQTSTPLRPGTSGCRSPVPSFNNKFTSQGVSSTLNIMNQNSSTQQFTPAQRFNSPANPSRYTGNQGDRPFSTHGTKPQSTFMTTPQTPLLTSRVAQLFQTPTSVKTATSHTRVRKFPGPAGVLPKLMEGQKFSDLSEVVSQETAKDVPISSSTKSKFIPSEGESEADFSYGAWKRMKIDLGLEEDNQHSILVKNNIALLLRKASLKQLTKNKVPHLCVMIKSITINTDAGVVLRDPTGEIQGTIHRHLMEEHQAELKPGCVLVLRQVGVLSPSLRNHYLNITPSNLIQVYPSESTLYQSSQQISQATKTSKKTCKEFACLDQSNLESSEILEVVGRVDSGQVKIHDETHVCQKITKDSELRQHDCRMSRLDTLSQNAFDADSNCRDLNKSMNIKSQQLSFSPKEDLELKDKTKSLDPKRQHREINDLHYSRDVVEKLNTYQKSVANDLKCNQIVVDGSFLKERNSVNPMEIKSFVNPSMDSGTLMASKNKDALKSEHKSQNDTIMVLNEKDQPSNHNENLQEDFTELLADIGDDFFDDF